MVLGAHLSRGEAGEADKGTTAASSADSPTTRLPALPVEIQLLVVQHSFSPSPSYTALPSRYTLLRTFALVCRTWHSFVRPLLLRDVVLPDPEKAQLFLRSLAAGNDDWAARVRTLRLGKVPWLNRTFEEMADEQERVENGELEDEWMSSVAEGFGLAELLRRCTGLKELWLAGIRHCLLSDLRFARSIETLHILRCSLCDCDDDSISPSDPPLVFPRLTRAEFFVRPNSTTVQNAFFSPSVLPALKHFSYACQDEDFPSNLSLSSITALSTVTDLPSDLVSAPLLFLDAYQLPVREALNTLPPSILILRLNDFSPLQHAFPWLLIDSGTSNELADKLPNLRELWLPQSYSEWRDDPKDSVRAMTQRWVKGWEARGVKVVFEEEAEENVGLVAEEKRLTEEAAFDFTFASLCRKVERWKLEEQGGEQ
ncbi:hypothetical protein JCM10213_002059 [Rhodosporidiobolus nylandii]